MKTYLLAVAALLLIPTALLAEVVSGHYDLTDKQWLFVCGEEYRCIDVEHDSETGAVHVNGCLMHSRKKLEKAPPRIPFSGLNPADTLYYRVPLIDNLVASGVEKNEAIAIYRKRINEIYAWARSQNKRLENLEATPMQVHDAVQAKLATDEYAGCMKVLQINTGRTLEWFPMSAAGISHQMFSCWTMTVPEEKPGAEYVDRYLNLFGTKDRPRAVVLSEGGGHASHGGRKGIEEVVKQLRWVITHGAYIEGPYSRRRLRVNGFSLDIEASK